MRVSPALSGPSQLERLISQICRVRLLVPDSPSREAYCLLITDLGSVFKAAIWTYIEPDAGIISACLPFLASVFGQRIADLLKALSTFGSRTALLLRLRLPTANNTKRTTTVASRTQRATYEEFDLDEDNDGPIPAAMKQDAGTESVRNLV